MTPARTSKNSGAGLAWRTSILATLCALLSATCLAQTQTSAAGQPATQPATQPIQAQPATSQPASMPQAQPAAAATPQPAPAAQTEPADPLAGVQERARKSKIELWRAYVKAPTEMSQSPELATTVQRVQAMQVRPRQEAASQPAPAPTSLPSAEPPKKAPVLTAEMIEDLKKLTAEEVADPAAIADALLANNQFQAACSLYERALKDAQDAETKAWLLLQIGNCRKEFDPAGAATALKRLVADYPQSPWAPVAETRARLIEWYMAYEPRNMLAQDKKLAQSAP